MHAFHGFDNMFIAHTQVPQSHDFLFQILPCGTSRIGCLSERNDKSTNSWRNKSCNSNGWRQSISYGMDYGLKWHPQQQNHPAVSETHWNHDTDGRTSAPRWDLKKKRVPGCWIWQQNGWKRERWHLFCNPSIIPGISNVESSGTSDSSDICRDKIYNLDSIQHMLSVSKSDVSQHGVASFICLGPLLSVQLSIRLALNISQ